MQIRYRVGRVIIKKISGYLDPKFDIKQYVTMAGGRYCKGIHVWRNSNYGTLEKVEITIKSIKKKT